MSFRKKFLELFSKKAASLSPKKLPNWITVSGRHIDISQLNDAQLAQLEAEANANLAERDKRDQELGATLLDLESESQRLLGARDFELWSMTLKHMFGVELGGQLAEQEITPGMEIKHLVSSFGEPTSIENIDGQVVFIYGNKQSGSYFEIVDNIITKAVIIGRPYPPILSESDEQA